MDKSIQIRDVPDELHRKLKARAAAEGRSLSGYLRAEIAKSAARPSLTEVLDRASKRPGAKVGAGAIVEAVRAGREDA